MQLNNIKVPDNQIVYGSIGYQNDFVTDNLVSNNPKYYLTRMLNIIFNSALSGSINSSINILSGLNITPSNINIQDDSLITITINPGSLIIDNTLLIINDDIVLDTSILLENGQLVNDELVIIVCYNFEKDAKLKFGLYFYDSETQTILGIPDDIEHENCFIYRYLKVGYNYSKISVEPLLNNTININGMEQKVINDKSTFKDSLLKTIEDNADIMYFIDLPYIPSVPNSTVFGITKIFTH
jgi:hypothetical protein